MTVCQKLDVILESKVVQKLSLEFFKASKLKARLLVITSIVLLPGFSRNFEFFVPFCD